MQAAHGNNNKKVRKLGEITKWWNETASKIIRIGKYNNDESCKIRAKEEVWILKW